MTRPRTRWGVRRGLPLSRLRSDGPVGPDFLERTGAVDRGRKPPRGLVPDLDDFASPDFAPAAVHPDIRAFYEQTSRFDLDVRPEWPRGAALARWVWRRLGRRYDQMQFPQAGEEALASRLVAVRGEADGRGDVRGWVRTRADGRALYVAAYAAHRAHGQRYANIAFPLPGGSLTSVLRWEDLPGRPGGLRLTTYRHGQAGDQGVYLRRGRFTARLPINETIDVWMDEGAPRAVHRIHVLGRPFLAMHYRMRRRAGGAP